MTNSTTLYAARTADGLRIWCQHPYDPLECEVVVDEKSGSIRLTRRAACVRAATLVARELLMLARASRQEQLELLPDLISWLQNGKEGESHDAVRHEAAPDEA